MSRTISDSPHRPASVAASAQAPAPTSEMPFAARSKTRVLLTTSLVSSLIMLDSNIVAVALPSIGQALRASFTEVEWVISAYLLTYAALLLPAGAYADLHGRRRAMLVGLVVFAAASAGCGLASSALALNLARAVQGVGGALLLTASLAIITHTFSGAERAHAFAVWGAALGVALAGGPVVGGAITNLVGWRFVFLVNIPLCAVLVLATRAFIAETRDDEARGLDLRGIATFSPGLFLLVWALIDGNDAGWSAPTIVWRLAGAALLFASFVALELRQARPMVDVALFRRAPFVGAVAAMLGYGAAAQVMVFYLPLFLQNAYGLAPASAGLAMLPFALPMVVAPRLTGRLARVVPVHAMLTLGLAVTLAGDLLFWLMARANLPYLIFAAAMLVSGAGAGVLNGETVKAIGNAVPPERAGMASGIASTVRFVGILVGVAALGAVLSDVARGTFFRAAAAAGLAPSVAAAAARKVTSGDLAGLLPTLPEALRGPLHDAGLAAFAHGFAAASLLAALVAAFASAATFVLMKSTRDVAAVAARPATRPCKVVDCRHPL